MPIAAGARLGHYEVLSPLGAGGMGEVYLARDTRLGRKAALKLLPTKFTQDEDRVRRFEQEARAASALNHPNIVTIYEIGEAEAGRFIVMEWIAGRTVRALIGEHAALDSLPDLGAQMARALSVAHAAGIIHRDIKPENIMLRDDGYVKVLDFGLARLIPTDTTLSQAETAGTTPGMLLGTVAYMSPEQARGEKVTSASDIFSLGIVFYELATGRHPFRADSPLGTLHAILSHSSLPPSRLNQEISRPLETLILQMLEKDARLRPSTTEVEKALQAMGREGDGATGRWGEGEIFRPVAQSPSHSIVGREKERGELYAGLASAAAGRGLLLCVAGEPGIGKTTLVEDFLAELAAGGQPCRIARGRCSERLAGTEAYLPLLEALDSLLRGADGEAVARVMKLLAPVWYAQIAPLTGEDSSAVRVMAEAKAGSQERMKRELAALFEELASKQPLVIFFDDLHWADVSTIDLLAFLGSRLSAMRVLIVTTYRPSDMLLAKHPFLQIKPDLQAHGLCREIALEFLSVSEIARYLALEFPEHRFPDELPALIHTKTEGSPLFMADLVRYLRDRHVIAQEQGRWALAQALPEIERELPESVRGMIERKIAQLGDEDRKLLVAASVQGYEFDSAVVAKVLAMEADEVEERLETLERIHAFVKQLDESEFPDRTLTLRYRFVHVLYQNVLYATLRPTRKVALSSAVAEALLQFYGEQSGHVASELALLLEAARDFARAAEYYRMAAQTSTRVFAYREAVTLAWHGLELLKSLPESAARSQQELQLHVAAGAPLGAWKGYAAQEVVQTFSRAKELCEQLGDDTQLGLALYGLGMAYLVQSEFDRAREIGEQLLQLGARWQDEPLEMVACGELAGARLHAGNFGGAVECFRRYETLLSRNPHQTPKLLYMTSGPTFSRCFGAWAQWFLGCPDEARRNVDLALAQAREMAHAQSLASAMAISALVYHFRRESSQVQRLALELIELAKEHGMAHYLAFPTFMHGWTLAEQGQLEKGLAMMEDGRERFRANESRLHYPHFCALLAEVHLKLGSIMEGLAICEDGITEAQRTSGAYYEAEVHRVKGELLWQQARPDEAEACFREAIRIAQRQSAKSLELRAVMSLARLWQQQDKQEEARAMLAEIYGWFTEGFDTADLKEAKTLLDQLS